MGREGKGGLRHGCRGGGIDGLMTWPSLQSK